MAINQKKPLAINSYAGDIARKRQYNLGIAMNIIGKIKSAQHLKICFAILDCGRGGVDFNKIRTGDNEALKLELALIFSNKYIEETGLIYNLLSTINSANRLVIDDYHFYWFESDVKATMWFWQYMRCICNSFPKIIINQNNIDKYCIEHSSEGFFSYGENEIINCPSSTDGRIKQIEHMLIWKSISYKESDVSNSLSILEDARLKWAAARNSIRPRAWEKSGLKIAGTWAFEALLDSIVSNLNAAVDHGTLTRFDKVDEPVRIGDLRLHLSPTDDDEALLAYYALAWRLQAVDADTTKKLLDDCAEFCNQKVRRYHQDPPKQRASRVNAEGKLPKRVAKVATLPQTAPKASRSFNKRNVRGEFDTFAGLHEQTVFHLHQTHSLVFMIGRPNARLNQLLIDTEVDSGFFVFADQVQPDGASQASMTNLEAAISIVVEKYQGVLVPASASRLDGAWPERSGFFILGGGKECAKAVLELLHATECVWCKQDHPPFIFDSLK